MPVPAVCLYRNIHFFVLPFIHIHIEAGIGTALGFHIGESFGNGAGYKGTESTANPAVFAASNPATSIVAPKSGALVRHDAVTDEATSPR